MLAGFKKMNKPFFTVIIPTYNCVDFLKRALPSVIDQTFTDFEVIVIDNSSTDGTREYLSNINDNRLNIITVQNNGIIAYSRNKGIMQARGQWLSFLDSDDLWYPNKLGKLYDSIHEHPEAVFICHDCKKMVNSSAVGIIKSGPVTPNMYEQLVFDFSILPTSTVTIKKSVALKTHGFSERMDFVTVEDYEYWIRLAKEGSFFKLPEVLGEYTIHGENESRKSEIQANAVLAVRLGHLEKWEKEFQTKATKEKVNTAKSNIYLRVALVYLKSYDFSLSLRYSRKAIKNNKFNLKTYLIFLLSLFKIKADYNKELNMLFDGIKPSQKRLY
jgi:glycosyltransferase involved in cell wall biosynthesis